MLVNFLSKLDWLGALDSFLGHSLRQIIKLGSNIALDIIFNLVKFIPQILFDSAEVFPTPSQISLNFAKLGLEFILFLLGTFGILFRVHIELLSVFN